MLEEEEEEGFCCLRKGFMIDSLLVDFSLTDADPTGANRC